MKKIIQLFILSVSLAATLSFASHNNFQFHVSEHKTVRQGGQTVDILVKYAIHDKVKYDQYPDYRALRKIAIQYIENPSAELPINVFWENIAGKIGNDLMHAFPVLSGVSIQLVVYPNDSVEANEPGFHGPIYTIGDVIPLAQAVMPIVHQ